MRGLLYVLEIVFFEVREADMGAASARAMAAYIQHGNLAQVVPLLPRQNACNKWQGYWRAGLIHVFKSSAKEFVQGFDCQQNPITPPLAVL